MCGEDTDSQNSFAKNTYEPSALVQVFRSIQLRQAKGKYAPGMVYFFNAIEVECGAEPFCSDNPLDGLALQL